MEVNQYLEMFIEESKEHLQACSEHLLELEKTLMIWQSLEKFSVQRIH